MQKKLNVIINRLSGTVLRLGEDRVRELITEAFQGRIKSLQMVEAKEICPTIDAMAHDPSEADLVVGGGDGTAVCAAEHLQGKDIHYGVLPLGTMNLMAQDLGSAPTFEETMQRFRSFREDKIDLGMVNGKFFLCSAVIGLIPESAVVREELRENVDLGAMARFIGTIARGMGGIDKQFLTLRLSDDSSPITLETTSLIISNNRFVRKPEAASERFLRDTLKDGKLAVYSAAPSDMIDGLRLMARMVQGNWQEDESVFSFESPSLFVDTPQDKILISLDGEPLEMTSPLLFTIREKTLPVLRMELAA